MSALRAAILDCLGADPDAPARPTVHEAMAACPRGEVRPACLDGQDVALAILPDGRPVLVLDRCPHDGGKLSDGFLEGDRLVCARHGWEFDLAAAAAHPGAPLRPVRAGRCAQGHESPGNPSDC